MSVPATITVQKVESGTTKGGSPIWKLSDTAGKDYATFKPDIGNQAMQFGPGSVVQITFEEKQNGQYVNRTLFSIEAATAPQETQPIANATPTGETDWDLIGLRKTRCALWAAYLASPLAASLWQASANPDLANAIYNLGRKLVEYAEFDIFARATLNPGEDPTVPF